MKSILIVDDSSFARRTLRKILEDANYPVDEAKDGSEALEKFFLKRPDLVLLDIVMEGMDGMEVLRKLHELDPSAEVVMATADIQSSTRAEAEALGAAGFISKPFNPREVIETVSRVLAGRAA